MYGFTDVGIESSSLSFSQFTARVHAHDLLFRIISVDCYAQGCISKHFTIACAFMHPIDVFGPSKV